MLDIKALNVALEAVEDERKIPKEKIVDAIEQSLAAAYKKDYGKKGQIVRAKLDFNTGTVVYEQVKKIVSPEDVYVIGEDEDSPLLEDGDLRVRYNEEAHIFLDDAKKIKTDVEAGGEIAFELEPEEDFGRIAAQTAKQVILQRIREAERESVLDEYEGREGEIINGTVQKIEKGNVFIDISRATAFLPREEQIPGENFRQGGRIKAYLYEVEEGGKGVSLKVSRTHSDFLRELFAIEAPEIQDGVVEIKAIAREPGSRSKIAVVSHDENVDPIGSCVGQKGIRVVTVMSELNGEKIDIIEWEEEVAQFIANALSPAQVLAIEIDENEHIAHVEVASDQLSLAIGKGGQNVRLAARLTGWRINVISPEAVALKEAEAEKEASSEEISSTEEVNKKSAEEKPTPEETAKEDSVAELSASKESEEKEEEAEETKAVETEKVVAPSEE
ncbi:MAG: N utilization substance protein A [Flavobacteriaceae bacterium]|jgi:N utilization substance protein A